MQITDMLNQYNRNIANGTETARGTQGIRQIVSSLQELSVGNVFEGNVNQMENGVVTLGLPDGKTIQARLDTGVSVNVGKSMFFQVKSNNGSQIAIRPFSGGANGEISNPTLLHALEAANLSVNGKTLTMVNAMMEQSMSIDRQSLLHMAKLVMGNEGMDITSIVQMEKLGIPVTGEMAAQFENYKSDQYALLQQMETMMEELPGQLSGQNLTLENLLNLNQQMLQIFVGDGQQAAAGEEQMLAGQSEAVEIQPGAEQSTTAEVQQTAEQSTAAEVQQTAEQSTAAEIQQTAEQSTTAEVQQTAEQSTETEQVAISESQIAAEQGEIPEGQSPPQNPAGNPSAALEQNMVSKGQSQLYQLFSGDVIQQLSSQLAKIPELADNPAVFTDGKLNPELSSRELLQFLEQAFSSKNPFSRLGLGELISSKNYRSLVRNVMEQEWLLRPDDLKSDNKVSELYQRLDRQLEQMEKVLKSFGQSTQQLSDTSSGIRNNIQFMNQLNQTYTYIQIPLKLAGQNAHSDLYVYTDKRKMQEKDAELTAFLHLDLDHLGSTDVSIRLHQRKVTTNFYLADDNAYQLILDHMDLLEARLEKKGYDAKIQVTCQEEQPDFVEHLLNQGTAAGGMVHRYSFDVRA